MRKILMSLLIVGAAIFIVTSATNAYFSDQETSVSNSFVAGVSSDYDVVVNEIFANPLGGNPEESAPMPGGEWVELYNNGSWPIDVADWYLYDAIDSHDLPITLINTGGSTMIPAKGYLVIYRNSDTDFSLNNDSDTVRLFNGPIFSGGNLINSRSYINPIETKSWSGMPNGTGVWSDGHTPTLGGLNV